MTRSKLSNEYLFELGGGQLREGPMKHLHGALGWTKLIGKAPAFLGSIKPLPAIARTDASVLITGETGTGKELVAREIHRLSPRAAFPFIPLHCGSLPDTLLENELFGHERGAFTDAHIRSSGIIAQAEKGTLFLDEVEAMSLKAQIVLLRVLQEKRFRALGSDREQRANFRVVAATNASLEHFIQAGSFRADLYYRLCVFTVHLPALRERMGDLMMLAEHFLSKHAPPGEPVPQLAREARAALLGYDWPGNVRELENAIVRGINLCQSSVVEVKDLGIPSEPAPSGIPVTVVLADECSFKTLKQKMIETFERDYIVHLMREHHGNISRAALAAGKERREIGKMLKKYRINPKLFNSIFKE